MNTGCNGSCQDGLMAVTVEYVDGSSVDTAVPCPEHYEGSKHHQAEEAMIQKVFGILGLEDGEFS